MRLKKYFFFFIFVFSNCLLQANASSEEERQLKSIQKQISQKESKLNKTKEEVDKLNKTLRTQNEKIQTIEKELKKISTELSTSRGIAKKNEQAIYSLRNSIKEEKSKLEKQIQLAFKQGQSSSLEMLFANTDAQKNDRMVGYINYVNREREATITKIQQQEASIQKKQDEIALQLKEQEKLVAQEQSKIKALKEVKASYAKNLKALDTEAQYTENQIIALKDDEINLKHQIDRAIKAAEKAAPTTITKLPPLPANSQMTNNNYQWPVKGKVLTSFGESLGGELTSKGMVIEAPITSDVKAIKEGNVLIADYLQGYGQVIVIDHGGDYMSLYGYNNNVLVSTGDRVKAGQVISKVGLVEGGYRSALYFEIRFKGEAIDPKKYLAR
ncbi:murein hydrolase activator EnvC family protein [Thorsellia kenyensis]|uniref:Murein hydrolase activator EnvC family protein n=1 Tax=Thorsellia kenyensis TaxID=1549888 RepID=A0ABV6CAW9_9GAMM